MVSYFILIFLKTSLEIIFYHSSKLRAKLFVLLSNTIYRKIDSILLNKCVQYILNFAEMPFREARSFVKNVKNRCFPL